MFTEIIPNLRWAAVQEPSTEHTVCAKRCRTSQFHTIAKRFRRHPPQQRHRWRWRRGVQWPDLRTSNGTFPREIHLWRLQIPPAANREMRVSRVVVFMREVAGLDNGALKTGVFKVNIVAESKANTAVLFE